MTYYTELASPLGQLLLVAGTNTLTGLYFVGKPHAPAPAEDWIHEPEHAVFGQVQRELQLFAEGKLQVFTVPVRLAGTPFQQSVWQTIKEIPFGKTIAYSDLSAQIGRENANRAVGAVTGRNPVSWIIPCHRVMGKDGGVTGYAGGVERKKKLLDFEAAICRGESASLSMLRPTSV